MGKIYIVVGLVLFLIIVPGCEHREEVVVEGSAGPMVISVTVDNEGQVSVSGGFKPRARVSLGILSLEAAVQETIDLTKERAAYTLFVVWRDEKSGDVKRDEYPIGTPFEVVFPRGTYLQEIRGDNHSVVVVIERAQMKPCPATPRYVVVTSIVNTTEPVGHIATSTRTPRPVQGAQSYLSYKVCMEAPPSPFTVGSVGYICNESKILMRSKPSSRARVMGSIAPNTRFKVVGGPECGDRRVWWKIQLWYGEGYNGMVGWMPESAPGGQEVFLCREH